MAQIDMAYAGKWWHKLLQIVFDPQAPSNDQMSSELGTKKNTPVIEPLNLRKLGEVSQPTMPEKWGNHWVELVAS